MYDKLPRNIFNQRVYLMQIRIFISLLTFLFVAQPVFPVLAEESDSDEVVVPNNGNKLTEKERAEILREIEKLEKEIALEEQQRKFSSSKSPYAVVVAAVLGAFFAGRPVLAWFGEKFQAAKRKVEDFKSKWKRKPGNAPGAGGFVPGPGGGSGAGTGVRGKNNAFLDRLAEQAKTANRQRQTEEAAREEALRVCRVAEAKAKLAEQMEVQDRRYQFFLDQLTSLLGDKTYAKNLDLLTNEISNSEKCPSGEFLSKIRQLETLLKQFQQAQIEINSDQRLSKKFKAAYEQAVRKYFGSQQSAQFQVEYMKHDGACGYQALNLTPADVLAKLLDHVENADYAQLFEELLQELKENTSHFSLSEYDYLISIISVPNPGERYGQLLTWYLQLRSKDGFSGWLTTGMMALIAKAYGWTIHVWNQPAGEFSYTLLQTIGHGAQIHNILYVPNGFERLVAPDLETGPSDDTEESNEG